MKWIFILFFASYCFPLFAQSDLVVSFRDDFNDNQYSWSQVSDSEHETEIADGKYRIDHKRNTGRWLFWKTLYLDVNKNFEITSSIAHTRGVENYGYGLVWGAKNASNAYEFNVSANGYFKIHKYVDGESSAYKAWTKSSFIKGSGEVNKLKIVKKSGRLYFYINGGIVHDMPYPSAFGGKIGFTVHNNQEIQAEYLQLAQAEYEINLVKDASAIKGKRKHLGRHINSKYSEVTPMVSPDGNTLYFTRKKHPENIGEKHKDDAWMATRDGDDWKNVRNFGFPVNNSGHNQVIAVSADNNTMLVANTYKSDGSIDGSGISITHKTADGWEIPQEVEIDDYVNDNDYHAFFLSSDKQILLMAVESKETYGDLDLHVSFATKDGFSKPKNLGKALNTIYSETTPFLAADNRTLYYSSAGRPGYGSNDIFVTRRLDDSWTKWSEPENLGPEINSAYWDAYFTMDASGKEAYFVSRKNTYGKADIFSITPPESSKPDPVVLVYGNVLDAKTKKPLHTHVYCNNWHTKKELADVLSNTSDGEYKMILPFGHEYSLLAPRKGYYPVSVNLDVRSEEEYTEIKQDLYLHPLMEGEVIPLETVRFERKSTNFKESALPELDRLAATLRTHPEFDIELRMYAENGEDKTMLEKQVKKLRDELIAKGIDGKKLKFKAIEDGKSKHKTVAEFKILDTGKDEHVEIVKNHEGDFSEEIKKEDLKIGSTFRLQNMYFAADSANITGSSQTTLDEVYTFLVKNPSVSIEIGGHTNGLPPHDYCDKLSDSRAKNAAKYLIRRGIAANRVSSKGYGKRKPIASNENLAGRRLNQRVEIKITNL